MNTITINRLNNQPESLGAGSGIGTFAIRIPESFEATKTIQEDVEVQKVDEQGQPVFDESGIPIRITEKQDVVISASDRLKDFTFEEIIIAKGQALLFENPDYTHVGVVESEDFDNVWDFEGSANFIAEYHQATLHPGTTVQTNPFPLQITASEVMCIWDFDEEIDVEVSLNNGASFTAAVSGVPETLSGNTIIVRCTNVHATDRKQVRGFSILYK